MGQRWRIGETRLEGLRESSVVLGDHQVRASFELPTAQGPLLSSPLPQTAEATPHFLRLPWRRAVPLGSTDKTYHEPLTYAMPREGYTRLPRAYISHPVELK